MLDSKQIKKDFPIFFQQVSQKELVYLDNAATSQKPKQVIEAISNYYTTSVANVHRGVHTLSDLSTDLFESGKKTVAQFFGASAEELIFVRNTTEAINGIGYGWGIHSLRENDVILVSVLDHHSNIVVWQEIAKKTGAKLLFCKITDAHEFDIQDFEEKVAKNAEKLKLVALPHVSNTLGTVLPIEKIVKVVKQVQPQARVLLDGAQAVPHMPVDFHKLGVDFYVFSGHKMLGPMGIGGLLVRHKLLQTGEMQPWLFGGGMISEVHEQETSFHDDLSERFVAGTPDVASVVGLAAACKYLSEIGMEDVLAHDVELVNYAIEKLQQVKHVEVLGPTKANNVGNPIRVGSVTFLYKGVHAHDVAQVLNNEGVAVRSGHHCTMPLHTSQNWVATTRASFQIYNSKEDIDKLVEALEKVAEVLL